MKKLPMGTISEESDSVFGWASTLAKSVYITRKKAHLKYLGPGQY